VVVALSPLGPSAAEFMNRFPAGQQVFPLRRRLVRTVHPGSLRPACGQPGRTV